MLSVRFRPFRLPRCSFWTATLSLKSSVLLHAGGIASILFVPSLFSFFEADQPVEMLGRSGVIVVQASMVQSAASPATLELPPLEVPVEETPQEEDVAEAMAAPLPVVEATAMDTGIQKTTEAAHEKQEPVASPEVSPLETAELVSVSADAPAQAAAERAIAEPPSEPIRSASAEAKPAAARAPAAPPSIASTAVPPLPAGFDTVERPDFANNARPKFPPVAQQNGWYGTVLLRLQIDAQGFVTEVTVQTSSGYPLLDNAATTAVQKWRAQPAKRNGRAVPTMEYLPVVFRPKS